MPQLVCLVGQEAELDEREVCGKLVFLISAYREPDKHGRVEQSQENSSSRLGLLSINLLLLQIRQEKSVGPSRKNRPSAAPEGLCFFHEAFSFTTTRECVMSFFFFFGAPLQQLTEREQNAEK